METGRPAGARLSGGLVVVPVVFEKVDDIKEWALRKVRGMRHHERKAQTASESSSPQV